MSNENKEASAVKQLPYSYHTFIYPFICKDPSSFSANLRKHWKSIWKRNNDSTPKGKSKDQDIPSFFTGVSTDDYCDYASFQYFSPSAEAALFDDDGIVENYNYNMKGKNAEYIISKRVISRDTKITDSILEPIGKISSTGETSEGPTITIDYEYRLFLNAIRLKYYPSLGVALVIFECEYTHENNHLRSSEQIIEDVKRINEYGRRLFPPFRENEPVDPWDSSDDSCVYSAKLQDKKTINVLILFRLNCTHQMS